MTVIGIPSHIRQGVYAVRPGIEVKFLGAKVNDRLFRPESLVSQIPDNHGPWTLAIVERERKIPTKTHKEFAQRFVNAARTDGFELSGIMMITYNDRIWDITPDGPKLGPRHPFESVPAQFRLGIVALNHSDESIITLSHGGRFGVDTRPGMLLCKLVPLGPGPWTIATVARNMVRACSVDQYTASRIAQAADTVGVDLKGIVAILKDDLMVDLWKPTEVVES